MRKILILCLVLGGCAEVRVSSDASMSDASGENSCGPYVNHVGVPAFACPWQVWQCSAPASAAEAQACADGVNPSATCDEVRRVLEACR